MVRTPTTVQFTRAEILERLEKGAQACRGMSASELVRAYRAGQLEEPGEIAALLTLADLLPDDDPILTAA